jgi:1-acyl-sn-glycerol-3-phosphate acyltransferase
LSLFYIFTPECKKTGAKLLIFPEGTVNHGRNGDFLPFKKGGFAAAIASQVTVGQNLISRKKKLKRKPFLIKKIFTSLKYTQYVTMQTKLQRRALQCTYI